jgi:predicted nucleotidyltransferase
VTPCLTTHRCNGMLIYKVRIDSNGVVGGYPALTIRKLVRRLNNLLYWNAGTVQSILRTERTDAEGIVTALVEAGLAVAQTGQGIDGCTTTPLAQSFGSATAAKPITRQTADRVLCQLLERVNQVNRDACFLAKVTKVVVLGSYLRAEVNRLSDLDIAVELQPKEVDWDRLRELTQQRVEQLRMAGRRFSNWLEIEYWWHLEAFRFLKGRSRAISLIDYKAEHSGAP